MHTRKLTDKARSVLSQMSVGRLARAQHSGPHKHRLYWKTIASLSQRGFIQWEHGSPGHWKVTDAGRAALM